jgi:hypothetical protein
MKKGQTNQLTILFRGVRSEFACAALVINDARVASGVSSTGLQWVSFIETLGLG